MRQNRTTASKVLSGLTASLSSLREVGIRINPSSRFVHYRDLLQHAADGRAVNSAERSQAHLDCSQLMQIVARLANQQPAGILPKLQLMMSDPFVPDTSDTTSAGRDAQFELFLASQFAAGGLSVSFDEPDLVLKGRDLLLGVAAKRIKSLAQLDRRLREGRDQLLARRGSVSHGYVAIDVTFAANPDRTVVISNDLPTGEPAAAELTAVVRDQVEQEVRRWPKPQHANGLVCGVLLFAAVTHYVPSEETVVSSASFRCLGIGRIFRPLRARIQSAVGQGW
jgi:hypothetical protein